MSVVLTIMRIFPVCLRVYDRRPRFSPLPAGAIRGKVSNWFTLSPTAASSLASAACRGSSRGAWGYLSPGGCHVNLAPAEREVERLALGQAAVATRQF
jgi:hypothetical protein